MRIVLDTNVLVSAFLKPQGKPARILQRVLSGEVTLLVDDRILGEYCEVLSRPKFKLPETAKIEVLDYISREGEVVPSESIEEDLPDADDLPLLEVAITGVADALVTGNKRHFPADRLRGVRVLSPAEFLRRVEAEEAGGRGK